MVLSRSQSILLAVSLALCLCFIVPRMIGGEGDVATRESRRMPHPLHGRPHKETPGKSRMRHGRPDSSDQMKSAMEQELKSEKTGSSRSMAFALMPMYAVGVALFAAYKFTKIKSKENDKTKSSQEDKKSKETEKQLLELEQHLSKTEKMLNSLLTQLDPLSNCVNTLAAEQKNEIMSQLQSIRQLMKTSGMDKSSLPNPANQSCNDTLEDLILSFEDQRCSIQQAGGIENESEEFQTVKEKHDLANESPFETSELANIAECDDANIKEKLILDGLRKRNVKD